MERLFWDVGIFNLKNLTWNHTYDGKLPRNWRYLKIWFGCHFENVSFWNLFLWTWRFGACSLQTVFHDSHDYNQLFLSIEFEFLPIKVFFNIWLGGPFRGLGLPPVNHIEGTLSRSYTIYISSSRRSQDLFKPNLISDQSLWLQLGVPFLFVSKFWV